MTAGTRDTSFGTNGEIEIKLPGGGADAFAVSCVDNHSSFVVLNKGGEFILSKRLENGGPNLSFGPDGTGYVTGRFKTPDQLGPADDANQVHVLDNGKILVVGSTGHFRDDGYIGIACFDATGAPDPDFGEGGRTVIEFEDRPQGHYVNHIASAVLPGGEILVALSSERDGDARLARLKSNGQLDRTFGTNGFVKISPRAEIGEIYGILVQKDLSIVVAGSGRPVVSGTFGFAARFTPQGLLDHSFGEQGFAFLDIANKRAVIRTASQDAHQNIYIAGGYPAVDIEATAFLASFTADGKTNESFNHGNGPVFTGVPNRFLRWVASQTSIDYLTVLGFALENESGGGDPLFLARFRHNGERDEAFGERDGFTVRTNLGFGWTITAQPDGRLLMVNGNRMYRFLAE